MTKAKYKEWDENATLALWTALFGVIIWVLVRGGDFPFIFGLVGLGMFLAIPAYSSILKAVKAKGDFAYSLVGGIAIALYWHLYAVIFQLSSGTIPFLLSNALIFTVAYYLALKFKGLVVKNDFPFMLIVLAFLASILFGIGIIGVGY